MRPGWRTSEMTISALFAAAIYELASTPTATLAEGIARAAGCLALAWIGGRYTSSRAQVKGRAL